jgi:DNA-binding transcriptional MerR regulator
MAVSPVAVGSRAIPHTHEETTVAWSTRELAELTGTTVNTIRHYHRIGLLEEPERRHNGYKQYGIPELVRLRHIRRLAELGVPLARIAEASPDGDLPPEALRQVDAGLAADIERLIQARSNIAAILRDGAPADTPRDSSPSPHACPRPTAIGSRR